MRARQRLRLLGNNADARLQIDLPCIHQRVRYSSRSMMSRPHTMMTGKRCCRRIDPILSDPRLVVNLARLRDLRNRMEERPNQPVEFGIGNEMGPLLSEQRSSEHTRKVQYRPAAARQTSWSIVFA